MSNELWIAITSLASAALGVVSTVIVGLIKSYRLGITASEAARLSDRKTFKEEMMEILAQTKLSASNAKKEAARLLIDNQTLFSENVKLRFEIEALREEVKDLTSIVASLKKGLL